MKPVDENNFCNDMWRIWISDSSNVNLEVLRVPDLDGAKSMSDYLFSRTELDELIEEIRFDTNLKLVSEERVSKTELSDGRVKLFGPEALGESAYYIKCKNFIAMANDPSGEVS